MARRRTAVLVSTLLTASTLTVGGADSATASARTTPFKLLMKLTVAPETATTAPASMSTWTKSSLRKCRDVRAHVLAADALGRTPKSCSTRGLIWVDPFTGAKVRRASSMTVERLVPIEEAWDSGASRWDARSRNAFANDLLFDSTLVAVTGKSAAKRKGRDPAGWLPKSAVRCDYVTRWISVKYRWGLSVDRAEADALLGALGPYDCTNRKIPAVKRAAVTLTPKPVPVPADPRYDTCLELVTAGLGPYLEGRDAEYAWYRDDDHDGEACANYENVQFSPSKDWRTERYVPSTTPAITAPVRRLLPPPGQAGAPRGYLHAQIVAGSTPFWHSVHPTPVTEGAGTVRTVQVPPGILTDGASYTLRTWSGYSAELATTAPSDAIVTTFRVDTSPPGAVEAAAVSLDGQPVITASSAAPDLVALRFTTNGRPTERVKTPPGKDIAHRPSFPPGLPRYVWIVAEDRAGQLSAVTQFHFQDPPPADTSAE